MKISVSKFCFCAGEHFSKKKKKKGGGGVVTNHLSALLNTGHSNFTLSQPVTERRYNKQRGEVKLRVKTMKSVKLLSQTFLAFFFP